MSKPYSFLKAIVLFSFVLLSQLAYSQTIEFNNKFDKLLYPDNNLSHFEEGFVNVSIYRILVVNEKSNSYLEKEWKNIKMVHSKFSTDFSFQPTFCTVVNNQIKVAINWSGKKSRQIILCTLDLDLNLVDEKIIAEIPYYNEKDKKNWGYSFHKSQKNNFYIFSQIIEFKPETGKGDHLDYFVFNDLFDVVNQGSVTLPKPVSKDYYRNEKNVGSIFCLEEGDPLINFDGGLFLLGAKEASPLIFELEHNILSYRILDINAKTIGLVGSYTSGSGQSKKSGVALIKLNSETLEQIDQIYIPLNQKFDIKADDLFEQMIANSDRELTINNSKPILKDAIVDKNGIIRVVIAGHETSGSSNLTSGVNNIDILGLSENGEIIFENVVAKRYMNTELDVLFGENKTMVFAKDHTSNFDENGNFFPNKKTNYNELGAGKLINHFIVFDHSQNKSTNKLLEFSGSNVSDYDNKRMTVELLKSTNPFDKFYIITRFQPNNTNFGKFGNVYTLIGTVQL